MNSVHPTCQIDGIVDVGYLELGAHTTIREHARVEGRSVVIGKHGWLDYYAFIGGGSCRDPYSNFIAGDHLHMGMYSVVNTAREVRLGDEVGLGIMTRIFTHGAYLSALDGFPYRFAPVTIGSRVWLPNAIVNPGVTIGDDVVVLPNSVVTKDIPSGSLAAGTPCKVVEHNAFPKVLSTEEKLEIVHQITREASDIGMFHNLPMEDVLPNQMRRYGVRRDWRTS